MRRAALGVLLCVAAQNAAGPARPAILGIAHVRVQTSDLVKARAFYGQLLGFPELRPDPRAGVAVFGVNARQRVIVAGGLPADRDERLMDLAFETGSVTAMREWLASHGLQPSAAAADPDAAGRAVSVSDPGGHTVLFVEPDAPPPSPASSGRADPLSKRILHAGLTVRDAAAADRFYKDVLGFSEIWRGGRTDDVTSWINMRVPDGTDYLEYMLQAGPSTRRQLGVDHHIALLVPDIQAALERVRARTAPDDPNHRSTPQIGRNNRWQLNLYDPDGTRIELMEPWTVR
jgi:catechol 2,3-dioxygenase-like lactoylglutathione lyase family enzyme